MFIEVFDQVGGIDRTADGFRIGIECQKESILTDGFDDLGIDGFPSPREIIQDSLCIRSGLLGMNLFEITKFMGRQTL
jgi:hypothetical protein